MGFGLRRLRGCCDARTNPILGPHFRASEGELALAQAVVYVPFLFIHLDGLASFPFFLYA
jgi:hypothetical protein